MAISASLGIASELPADGCSTARFLCSSVRCGAQTDAKVNWDIQFLGLSLSYDSVWAIHA